MQLAVWTYEGPPHVGAMRVATAMEKLHYVLHAPQGDTYADLLFTMIERRDKRPPVTYTTFQARDLGGAADLVVFDMVLHHIATPAATFKDVAALLKEDGLLLVIELCSHDQDWVRSSCGDLWLGFDESELDQWAVMSGLRFEQGSNLALRNGFQIQMRVFKKHAN